MIPTQTSDDLIASALGSSSRGSVPIEPQGYNPYSGNTCHRLFLEDGRCAFVKRALPDAAPQLLAEAAGLIRLAPHLRVPAVLAQGEEPDGSRWLALEWLLLVNKDRDSWFDFGRQLAALHSVTRDRHGLSRDNFFGTLPQDNTPAADWREFFIERRLRPQIRLAMEKGRSIPEADILNYAERILADHEPRPALLHGNLWSSNRAALAGSKAVCFEPAPYFGDPEVDLALLGNFRGDFPEGFVAGYGELPDGLARNGLLYELRHILVRSNIEEFWWSRVEKYLKHIFNP